jgi:hypothetical protein
VLSRARAEQDKIAQFSRRTRHVDAVRVDSARKSNAAKASAVWIGRLGRVRPLVTQRYKPRAIYAERKLVWLARPIDRASLIVGDGTRVSGEPYGIRHYL